MNSMACNCGKKTAVIKTSGRSKGPDTTPKKTGSSSRTTRRIIRRASR